MDKRALEAYILKQGIDSHKNLIKQLEGINENLKNLQSPQMIEELIKKEKKRILIFNGVPCEESTLKTTLTEMREMLEAKEEIYKQLTVPSFEPPEKKSKFEFPPEKKEEKKYIGVVRNGSKWRLQLRYKNIPIQVCGYATPEEAAREYDQAKVDLWGSEKCGKLNFMENMSEYLKNKSKINQVQGILYDKTPRSP